MKKLHLVVIAVIAAATLAGCGNSTPKANLKSDIDTLSYAFGLAQTKGLKEYLAGRMGVDTAYMDQFIKGLNAGMNASDDPKHVAYNAGVQIGQQINNQMMPGINNEIFGPDSTQTISRKNFMAGFITGINNGKSALGDEIDPMMLFQMKMGEVKEKEAERQFGGNRKAGEKFLFDNARKPGVQTLPSGVQYKVLKEGNGEIPSDSSTVTVNYEGRLLNDTIFDSSYTRGQPAKLRIRGLIPGWQDALTHMPVGSAWEIYVPQEQAYGSRGAAKIEPFSMLIFKVELLSIEK
ncbi:MAG: FKBP-type peptidyl-prolyl cis-trans isomerase [Prevotella sp.]|nr:FKBP-type peptidyl-prolyl cis-trans isomerase [Prevotella sp.]